MNPDRSVTPDGAGDDSEVIRILDAYMSGIEAGLPADPDKLLADHPALAGQLRAYLELMGVAGRLAEGSRVRPEATPAHSSTERSTSPPGSSLLTTLNFGAAAPPHIHLRELPDEREPLVQPRSAEMPRENGAGLGRFQLQGEIARGGMGAILKGRDVDLGRDLAIKVMLESHQGNPEVTSRFVEEAQIGGQLQHPGVVPVYELGTFPDRRPYFAMKLVKGQTLAALLAERRDRSAVSSPLVGEDKGGGAGNTHDLPRFLSIFEQVCQTVAYAHARGVIHRDLKPSNVMVGAFGEVQVMDWGLAKVLPRGGVADEAEAQPARETVIMTVRSGSSGGSSESQAGSVLGTPAYMAPEQARGDLESIDERADVFGLGAILCEILTGQPPFGGSSREEIRAQASRGDLADAAARLETCGADVELIELARNCLRPERDKRPRNAGEVARRMTAHLAGVQERLHAAELARVEAQARAAEERKRRRLTVGLAGSVLIIAGLAGGGWAALARQWQERGARFALALGELDLLRGEAERAGDDLALWQRACDSAHACQRLFSDAPDEPTRRHARALGLAVTGAAEAAETDQKLLAKVVDIRSAKEDDPDGSATDAGYHDAFREAGIDVAALPPTDSGPKIRARPTSVRVALAAALDDWAAVRRARHDHAGALRLTEAARLADPDAWRNRLRELLQSSATPARSNSLKDLAKTARAEELPAVSLHLLGANLSKLGELKGAEALLRAGQRLYPGDVWLNIALAQCLEGQSRRQEAIRYYMAARSVRPETAHVLAHALEQIGETDQAITVFQDVARLCPKVIKHLVCLGEALKSRGRSQEATAAFDAAIGAGRQALPLKPHPAQIHFDLGRALNAQGKLNEAIAEYREALRLKTDFAVAHVNLGDTLSRQGKQDAAIAECRQALRLEPDLARAHGVLGCVLIRQGKPDEAIAELRESLRIKPHDAVFRTNLGVAFAERGALAQAIAEYREAVRLKPDDSDAHSNLGGALREQGKLAEAIAELRESLRLKPDCAGAHGNLGLVLDAQGKHVEAIAEYRTAMHLDPDDWRSHYNIGLALVQLGNLDTAIAEFRKTLRLKPDFAAAHNGLGNVLRKQGKFDEAIAECREALRLKPNSSDAHNGLGAVLSSQGKRDEAIAEFRLAVRLNPDNADTHNNLGAALHNQAKVTEAISEFREALRLKPDDGVAHENLGIALHDDGKLDEAFAELREALRINADDAEAHRSLGAVLDKQGKLDEATAELREALRLKPDLADAHYNIAVILARQGKLDAAIAEYRTAIRQKPDYPEAHCNLGQLLRQKGKVSEALTELKRGHELGSTNPRWPYPSEQWVKNAERLVELDGKLPAILGGKRKPADAAESLELAQLCYTKKLHGASARFWSEGFRAQPALVGDMQAQHRYNAACAAALAGCGQGKDDPPPDETAKARWRNQAIDWLKADLAARSKLLEKGPPQARQAIPQTLQHWKVDTDLAGLRDPEALKQLSEDEQKACRALWAEVDSLLAKASGVARP
jgi:serine/threonine-protein kinase